MAAVEDGSRREKEAMLPDEDVNLNTTEFYNSRSRVLHADDHDKMIFFFDYRTNGKEDEQLIQWKHLKTLKDNSRWGVLRHPMVLQFVNERLLDCALFYALHVFLFLSFLVLLTFYVFQKKFYKELLITALVIIFFVGMMLKGAVKSRIAKKISLWFVIAYIFNLATYAATLMFIWLPYMFKYDDFHQEAKNVINWFLPIIAIISALVNFLYILRKSPYGIYIFMMVRIMKSFGHISTIWIPTLLAFTFAFHLILRDTGVEPWESSDKYQNSTVMHQLFVMLQAVTKTSTMMIGEVDANDILGTGQWIPSLLVILFEILTVILLMNLMVSLAVGDVHDLRNTAQDKILKIKVNYVVEALQLSEQMPFDFMHLYKRPTNNVLVVETKGDKDYYTLMDNEIHRIFDERRDSLPTAPPRSASMMPSYVRDNGRDNSPMTNSYMTALTAPQSDLVYHLSFSDERMRLRMARKTGRTQNLHINGCTLSLVEAPESGIPEYHGLLPTVPESENNWLRNLRQWIIGLEWKEYLEL